MSPVFQWNGRTLGLVGVAGLMAATALAANDIGAGKESAVGKVAEGLSPKFTPEGGAFTDAVRLRLNVDAASGVVRYTLDGTEPTAKSEAYSKELTLTAATLVQARAFGGNQPVGPIVSQTYTFLDR